MTKKEKFKKLAERRVSNAIKQIRLVGNLSNKSLYEYTESDVSKIKRVLNSELNAAMNKFSSTQPNNDNKTLFSFDMEP